MILQLPLVFFMIIINEILHDVQYAENFSASDRRSVFFIILQHKYQANAQRFIMRYNLSADR